MKKLFAFVVVGILLSILAGCGAQEVPFEPDPEFQPTPEMEEMARMAN